jgi:hypothetical protein
MANFQWHFLLVLFLGGSMAVSAQDKLDSLLHKFKPEADFRFRVEQDWNSRKPDGTYRNDRTRLRYRARFGLTYNHNAWASFGFRIRTGDPRKQQDPQITLGTAFKEFGTIPLGFEKLFFKAKFKTGLQFWLGKNTYPFYKNNELLWSDNVFPEGVAASYKRKLGTKNALKLNGGHFIVASNKTGLDQDRYFSAGQLHYNLKEHLNVAAGFFYFHNMPNIPDGGETFDLNYRLVQLSTQIKPVKKIPAAIELDLSYNLEDYTQYDSIPKAFQDQKLGLVAGLSYGKLKTKGNWKTTLTYAYLEQYSAVDIFTQNDWARWDYSSFGSPDGRLTNMQGVEAVLSYLITPKIKLTTKYYHVLQLVKYGSALETNDRIRFDIDIKF